MNLLRADTMMNIFQLNAERIWFHVVSSLVDPIQNKHVSWNSRVVGLQWPITVPSFPGDFKIPTLVTWGTEDWMFDDDICHPIPLCQKNKICRHYHIDIDEYSNGISPPKLHSTSVNVCNSSHKSQQRALGTAASPSCSCCVP